MSVYFITAPELGLVKIGYSNAPKRRLNMLQTGSPVALNLAAVIPAGVVQEKQLHHRFRNHKKRLEWFEITEDMEALIERHPIGDAFKASSHNYDQSGPCMNIDQYLSRKGSLSLTELSARIGVSKSRLSQLRYAKQLPPELALNLERETAGAVDASKFSKVIADARGKAWSGEAA